MTQSVAEVPAEHTAGPWEVFPHYCKNDPDPGPYGNTWLIGLGQFDTIAEVRPGHDEFDSHNDANARLIAAAPDLLLGLQRIFARLDRGEGAPGHSHDVPGIWDADNAPGVAGTKCEWCAQWEEARGAIAKATRTASNIARSQGDE